MGGMKRQSSQIIISSNKKGRVTARQSLKGYRTKKMSSRIYRGVEFPAIVELKELYTTDTAIASGISQTGNVFNLNSIAESAAINGRVGRHICMKSIDISYYIRAPQVGTFDYVFLALVYDRQPNNSLPVFGAVFDTGSGSTNGAVAFKNTGNFRDRFLVLKEERIITNQSASNTNNGNFASNNYDRWHVSLDGLPCEL